ncbi:MAG: hypothetical protein LUD68_01725 [Rikenellaceae bacterium]|nr:hypothetical protein [Rikenellaceae bacterium]
MHRIIKQDMNRLSVRIRKPRRKRIRPAIGIRRKIGIGFVILGSLLLFAGMVSYFELTRLNRTTTELLDNSLRDLGFSQRMLEAIGQQNDALALTVYSNKADSLDTDSLLLDGRLSFEEAFFEARARNVHSSRLQRIEQAKQEYDRVLLTPAGDSLAWYKHPYKLAYYNLLLTVKDFMISSQNTIDQNTEKIQDNAYRAIMPGIITLTIAILIIGMFYLLIDFYYIRPVLKIKQGLDNYLDHKMPYHVRLEGRDEIRELSDRIKSLMTIINKKEPNA